MRRPFFIMDGYIRWDAHAGDALIRSKFRYYPQFIEFSSMEELDVLVECLNFMYEVVNGPICCC